MVRLAMVQPNTAFGVDARRKNMEEASEYVWMAARAGADIVSFPETYPGLWRAPVDWTPVADLGELAGRAGVHIIGGYIEPADVPDKCFNSLSLFGPEGKELGRYRRTTPNIDPWIYRDGDLWGFEWARAVELPVFKTSIGTIGLAICSEVYVPEIARALALQGADLLFFPAGTVGPSYSLFHTWRTLIWARAIENLVCTAISSNVVGPEGDGLAMVCAPEEVLFESHDAGLHIVDVDLDRIRWLREQEDGFYAGSPPYRTKPGLLRDWRHQAVLDANKYVFDLT